jgi:hypothetical protein
LVNSHLIPYIKISYLCLILLFIARRIRSWITSTISYWIYILKYRLNCVKFT